MSSANMRGPWRASDRVVESMVGDETVLLHLDSGLYFGLDAVGTVIWSQIKGGATAESIGDALVDEFDVDRDRATQDLLNLVGDLRKNDILADA